MNARWMGTDIDHYAVLSRPGDVGIGAENYHFNLMVCCPVCEALHVVTIAPAANRWRFDQAAMTLVPSVRVTHSLGVCHWNLTDGVFIVHADSNARKVSADE